MKPAQILLVLLAAAGGWCAARFPSAPRGETAAPTRKVLYYQSPMHPWVKSDKPGQCTVCGMNLAPVYEGGESIGTPGGVVRLSGEGAGILGLETSVVEKRPILRTLRVSGIVGEDESRHGVVTAPVEGRIDGLAMSCEGQHIARRQPLLNIFSRTLLAAAKDYTAALGQSEAAAEEVGRRLEQYGLVWEQIKAIPRRQPDDIHFGILAPLSGSITKSYVSEGQYVREGEKLFEIADFAKMWFVFAAAERDLPLIRQGQIVTVSIPSLPGRTIKAKVAFVNPNLDEVSRSARVRVVLENPDGRIKNNTFAEGILEVEAPEALSVPRAAVLWPGGAPRVYVEQASGSYLRRRVKLGLAGETRWEILDGLREGERVVTSGQLLLDSQAQLDAMAEGDDEPARCSAANSALPSAKYLEAVSLLGAALADDDLAAANAVLAKLPPAPEGLLASPAPRPCPDLLQLRQAFLPWSRELAGLAARWKPSNPEFRVFRCSMTRGLWPGAPAEARWIQAGSGPRNPYWGKAMRDCGVEQAF